MRFTIYKDQEGKRKQVTFTVQPDEFYEVRNYLDNSGEFYSIDKGNVEKNDSQLELDFKFKNSGMVKI